MNEGTAFEARNKWGRLVGRFILAFGDIESITYLCIAKISSERKFKSASKQFFGKRVDFILELLQSEKEVTGRTREFLSTALKKSVELSKKRNILAHSPIHMRIYEQEHTGDLDFQEVIMSLRNQEESITYQGLEKLVEQAEALSMQVNDAYNELLVDINE